MRITGGNVGIGTSLIDSSDGRLKLSAPSGNSNPSSIALYGNNGGAFGGSNVVRSKIDSVTDGTAFGANMRFFTNDTSNVYQERLRIDSSGNVGINQTNPDLFAFSGKELHVKGGTGTNESASFIAESAQSASGFLGGYYWVNGSATNEFQKRVRYSLII